MAPPTRNRPAVPANQWASLVYEAGGRGDGQVTAVATILRESGGRPDAYRPEARDQAQYDADPGKYNRPGRGNDRGPAQFNDKSHPDVPDADAYDPARSVAHMARKTAGFTNFGTWDMGPNAYSGEDKLPALMASDEWSEARRAVANPAPYAPAAGDGTTGEQYTDGETRLIARWDSTGDGRLDQSDITAEDERLAEQFSAGWSDAELLRVNRAIDDFGGGGSIRTGFLLAYKQVLGVSPTAVLNPPAEAWLKRRMIRMATSGGRWFVIPLPGGGSVPIPGSLDTVGDIVSGLTPAWMDGLGRLLGNLLSGTFWRRILIVLGGVALIVLAVVLANRNAVMEAIPG